jgi:predicted neuraminidase
LPDGELFAVWYAFQDEGSPNTVIWGSRRPVGSDRWTAPSIIQRDPGYTDKNPVLYLGSDKKLFLFWAIEKRWLKLVKDAVRMKRSDDSGRTWGEARNVSGLTWFLPRTHPIRLHNGDIILPVYTDLTTSSAVAISKDGGLTWKGPEYILFFLGIQPTIIERSDLSLFTLMRCGMTPRLAWQAVSNDSGKSWRGREYSDVDNPGTSLEMIKLNNGHVVLAFNDSKESLKRMLLALSYDEGRTWPYKRAVEFETEFPNTYPSLAQDRYGLIHLLYSYNGRENIAHFVTDEEWIKGGNGSGYRR